jgi:hypothetical protein
MLDEHGIGYLRPHDNAVIVRGAPASPGWDARPAGGVGPSPRTRVELWNLSGHPARYVPAFGEDGEAITSVVIFVPGGLVLLVREASGVRVDRQTNQPNVVTCTLIAPRALIAFTAGPIERGR